MKKILAVLSLSTGLVFSAAAASADTLQLVSTGGEVVGGEYVYPYNFSIDGASQLTPLMCLNFNRHITFGETWNASIGSLPLDNSQASINYRADAWIYAQRGTNSYADVQYAVWDIFDPQDINGNPAFDATAQLLATTGLQMAVNQNLINSGYYAEFALFQPTSDQTGWTDGKPQDFLGIAVAPEPSSFVLLGSGLVGIAGALRRRLVRG